MLRKVFRAVWQSAPRQIRRWAVLFSQARFTVTAAGVILDHNDRLLLLKHVFRMGSGWGIPGGFMTGGEQPEQALRRELKEEIGMEIESAELAFVRSLERVNQIEIVFLCRPAGEARPQSNEIETFAWFMPDELPKDLSRDQRRLIERALKIAAHRKIQDFGKEV